MPPVPRIAVSRFMAKSDLYEFDLVLDVNTDLYPLKVSRSLTPGPLSVLHTMNPPQECTTPHSHFISV